MLADVQSIEFTETLAVVDQWLHDYICQPHPMLGRSGPVCPFVASAQRADSVEAHVRLVGPAPSVWLIAEMLRCALDEFDMIPWRASNPALHTLLVIVPDLPDDRLHLLDASHRLVKPEAVRRGMMVGQFHANCQERAAHNANFPVSRSPVPVVVLRHMSLHDILFLRERREWFAEYSRRFGGRFSAEKNGIEPLYLQLFEEACAKYGPLT